MSRIEDIFMKQKLTEIESIKDEDKIMATLSQEKTEMWRDIIDLNAEGILLAQEYKRIEHQLLKTKMRFESKQFLFWDAIEQADERFESVTQRGKTLAIKKDEDGKLVVVEFDAPQNNLEGMGIYIMPPPEDQK